MHIEERAMPCSAPKSIFPVPINGQTLMFSNTSGNTNRCNHGRGTIHALPHSLDHSRCSCESNSPTGYNRVLLPATSHTSNEQIRLTANVPASLTDSWLRIPAGSRANYESLLLNGFPLYGKFAADSYPSLDYALLANARRKNATRETTSTLKAWLNEHKKNPYPTKGEKIMLAILTKMTLTQVSTWFANARRRLKKENKMTWSPRKKSGEKKNNDGGDDESCLSDSDVEGMDVDVEEMAKDQIEQCQSEKPGSCSESAIQRPSVIRTLESPTFNEIRDRFKDEISPVKNLQKWVNGCIKLSPEDEQADFPDELTPPSTPIENKTTTFSSQTLFEAFDAAKNNSKVDAADVSKPLSVESSYTKEPLHLIFSSKQPVCSPKEVTTQTVQVNKPSDVPSGIITPQPSPKNDTQFLLKEAEMKDKPEVRVQGLTTSRELEAVLALTNLCKT